MVEYENTDEVIRFTTFDNKGNRLECEGLLTFESPETGKSYIVYTDNSVDEEGDPNIFASVFDAAALENENVGVAIAASLAPIETEEDWELVLSILEDLQQDAYELGFF